MTDDDPRFRTERIIDRNIGSAETARLERGALILTSIIGKDAECSFYHSFANRCGPALPTAMVQLLDFVERRLNSVARQRDPETCDMFRSWRTPSMMDAIYLNACVEAYNRDKVWAQKSNADKELSISLERFGEQISGKSAEGMLDKVKETGIGLCLAAGLSFASDSMSLVEKLPAGMRTALEEASKEGVKTLSILGDLSAHNVESMAVGIVLAVAVVVGKSVFSAAWTAWREKSKREYSSYELPRSLVLLDRDRGWEPQVLGRPELVRGLRLKVVPPVWDRELLAVLSENRRTIRAHSALAAEEIKQVWSLLSEDQRKASKDMSAPKAIAIAASALCLMRERAEKQGYGSLDYASLDPAERTRIMRLVFDQAHSQELQAPSSVLIMEPLSVKQRLLVRRTLTSSVPVSTVQATSLR